MNLLAKERPSVFSPAENALIAAGHDGRRQAVTAADRAALALGVWPGMALAQAQALVPGLAVVPADPEGDAAGIERLAAWCLRYAPLAAPDPPDGLLIDITGCAHLFGGEAALLADLLARLEAAGIAARAAVADTPGAAHALARHGADAAPVVVPPGGAEAALAALPVAALRLAPEAVETLHRLGVTRISALAALPRAPLTRRFGPDVLRRLDQALGRCFEPIRPLLPPGLVTARLGFVEPLLTAEAFAAVITQLTDKVCGRLEQAGAGARRIDLLFERVDGSIQALRVGTARPNRTPTHLARLLTERLETVDPGLGVETMRLIVPLAEPLVATQSAATLAGATAEPDLSDLVDRLTNRLGATRVYRVAPVESDVPERSVRRIAAVAPAGGGNWPGTLPRPVRLLSPPQPVEALALLPDRPPAVFSWRRKRFRVRRADGPERIHGEWWRRGAETAAIRDYWRVEDEDGRRFWLYRSGDGEDAETGDLRWFLHGLF